MPQFLSSPTLYIVGGAVLFWIYKRVRGADIQSVFIHDMATNHLPHIYHRLNQIAEKLDLTPDEPPAIKFIAAKDFKDKEG